MDSKKKRILIIAAALGIVALAALALFLTTGGAGRERTNMLTLAREYIERGDYDRALDLLDKLIIRDVQDSEARALRDEALEKKAARAVTG